MRIWMYEARLLMRSRLAAFALILMAVLSIAAVIAGLWEVASQRAAIARIAPAQADDIGAVADWIDKAKDPGSAAYYSFHPTWDAPSPLAFAAIGMRDVAPYILRVRALGLEAQIYDGDVYNAELALPGRFDFAFVLVFLGPLFVIALFHDLVSGEREAGRARMLAALPGGSRHIIWRRGMLRLALLSTTLAAPFVAGAIWSGADGVATLTIVAVAIAYLAFWAAITTLVSWFGRSSVANAAMLAAIWLMTALIAPTLAHVAINQTIPVDQGAEIVLAQREQVNRAWDIPREETMRQFYAAHPEWADSPPLPATFHYKWYFAFHQVGDEAVAAKVRAYRAGLERRSQAAAALGWILPSVGVQAILTRLAGTDLIAQLDYQDRVRAYHRRLRNFYYAYMFRDRPFGKADFGKAPRFSQD
ncbi:ABC transporter permease [Sphingomonas mollis]|uniref:DUF3526 domain-containing protein n=1 Tax=Sphingomonas mollis TaxID=2795726 RepID=A0ABS0XP01_9SPHN|nr:DUF3526 domain-containing protein [Sphingomonas sp. BT553]MBJ6121768.1 DUF3526 domain-containing protein [Sphingomonas sp. BT553]